MAGTAAMPSTSEQRSPALFYGLLAVFLWAPWPLGSNQQWSWSLLCLLIFLLTGAWLLQFARGRVSIPGCAQSAWPAVAILCWVQLWVASQLLPLPWQSSDLFVTRQALLLGVAYTCAFWLVLVLVNSGARLRIFAYVIVAGGVIQATYGGVMLLSGLEHGVFTVLHIDRGRANGTFINPNHLAGYLEISLAVGTGLLLADLHRDGATHWRDFYRRVIQTLIGRKLVIRLCLVVMVIGLVLTRSRMGNIAFFSSLVGAGAVGLWLQRRLSRNAIILFASLLVVDLMIVGNWFGLERLAKRMETATLEYSQRDQVAGDMVQLVADNWLTGTGAGSFYTNFPKYRGTDTVGFNLYAHNDYMQFWAEFGLLGAAPLGLVVLWGLYNALAAQRLRRDRLSQGMGFAAAMGITALLVHSAADFNLQIPANALLFVGLLAIGWLVKHPLGDTEW